VELFVASAVDVLLAVAVPVLLADAAPGPVVTVDVVVAVGPALVERPLPPPLVAGANDIVGGLTDDATLLAVAPLVELVATLSIVAPRPAEPAEAAPVDELPPPELGGVETVTVGALVSVPPEVTVADGLEPVLVNVWPEVTSDDWPAFVLVELDCGGAGKPCTPLPTWPCPPLPGVGPPIGSVAFGLTVCAATGRSMISNTIAASARTALMPQQRDQLVPVPDRWLRRCASATVTARRTRA